MESFYETHTNLVEHVNAPVRRTLMDEVDRHARLIGIKGTRGVGKTTFLLQYAKEVYGPLDRRCLYVNINNFYFQGRGFFEFAGEFVRKGGQCLLIDQVFKYPGWSAELRKCYDHYPSLQIIFTGSSVMRLKEENPEIGGIVKSYNLRGFSFREYLNLVTGNNFPVFTLDEILSDHERLIKKVLPYASPSIHFHNYLRKGFYPFHLENRNFSENLLKTMNMITEVDILLIKQIELKYLTKIKKLFYLIAQRGAKSPNVSTLAQDITTSRATVMNYIKYLADARLLNIIYCEGAEYPKKPTKLMMQNPNLLYAIYPAHATEQEVMETFFVNALWKDHTVNQSGRDLHYKVDEKLSMRVVNAKDPKVKYKDNVYYARYNTEIGRGISIPLWLFGFLY